MLLFKNVFDIILYTYFRNSANNLTEINKELEQEVTRFLRRNNENPCYIMELFQKLSMMETDYARHRALTALQNVLSDVLPSEMLLGAVGCESNPNNNSRNQFTSTRNITDLSSLNSSESQFNRQPQAIVPPYQENELAERSDNEGVSQDTEIARAPRGKCLCIRSGLFYQLGTARWWKNKLRCQKFI